MTEPELKINSTGIKSWCLNGKLHREDGPAIEHPDGTKAWCLNGELHREDGPAVEHPHGTKEWYLNGIRHREDGPAIEYSDGAKFWYLNGNDLTFIQWLNRRGFNNRERLYLMLKYGQ